MDTVLAVLTAAEVAQALRDFVAAREGLDPRTVAAATVKATWKENGPGAVMIAPAAPSAEAKP